jgi:hypothetical protein
MNLVASGEGEVELELEVEVEGVVRKGSRRMPRI